MRVAIGTKTGPRWQWNSQRRLAVRLVARGDCWLYEIAAAVGISNCQLRRWRQVPEFRSAVRRNAQRYGRRLLKRRIGVLLTRMGDQPAGQSLGRNSG